MPPVGRFVVGFLVTAGIVAASTDCFAGTIGFRTDAEVTSGPGIDAKVTLTHTGDETADNVNMSAQLLDRKMDGTAVASMRPGQNQVWNFHLFDEIPKGVYAIVLRTRYSDTNGYPFEVISTADATVGVQPAPRIHGSLDVPRLSAGGEATAKLTARKPPERSGSFEVRLVAPAGLEVRPERLPLTFDASGKATADFRVRNLKLLAGTTVSIYGLITGTNAGLSQSDTIRGSVRIATPVPRVTFPMFYQAAAAVFLLLALLEGVAWASARRSPKE